MHHDNPGDEGQVPKRRRKRRTTSVDAIKIPADADLCYCFPDGGSFAGVIKLISSFRNDGNFRFNRDEVSFARSNPSKAVLAQAVWIREKIMIKGNVEEIPESGFSFGVDLKKLHSIATKTLTKNDLLLLFFRGDNNNMYVEQINHKTTLTSGNETPFINQRVPVLRVPKRIIGVQGRPNVSVCAEEFFIQINILSVIKCNQVIIRCNRDGMRMSNEDKDNTVIKCIKFGPARHDFDDEVTLQVHYKLLKTILQMRNICKSDSNVRIFFANGMPLLLVCSLGPKDDPYGHFQLVIKEEKQESAATSME